MSRSEKYRRFYEIIGQIPAGKVATYGQIAALAGFPGQARQVGYALHAAPEGRPIPWQRVVNAQGGISPRANPLCEQIQRELLISEGIRFDPRGRIPLQQCQWKPR